MASWVVTAAVLIVSVALLELALRRLHRRRSGYYVNLPWYRRELEFDRETYPHHERCIRLSINSNGEAGAECPRGVPGLYRILFVGGSAVECGAVDQSSSWPARVELALSLPDRLRRLKATRVHVGNIGRSGLDVRAIDVILERLLPRYGRLDLIGFMVGAGDLLRWTEAGAPPLVQDDPVALSSCFADFPERAFGWRPKATALAWSVAWARRRVLRPVDRWSNAGRWLGRARRSRQNALEMRTSVPDAGMMLDIFERHLRSAVRRAAAVAPRVLLIRQPSFRKTSYTPMEEALFWHGGIGSAYREDPITVYFSTDVLFALHDLVDERTRAVAEALGVEYLDPAPFLEMSADTFYDHFHLTASGCAALGEAVAGAVVENRRGSSSPA